MKIVGHPEYINKKCWLVNNAGHQVLGRCRYCQRRWRNCLTFQYMVSLPIITVVFFVAALVLQVKWPEQNLIYLVGGTTFIAWLGIGYLYNVAVDSLVESSYRLSLTHEELAEKTIEQAALYDIVRMINSTFDLGRILGFAAKGAATAAGANASLISLIDEGKVTEQEFFGLKQQELEPEVKNLINEIIKTVMVTGNPIVLEDVRKDPKFASMPISTSIIRSFVSTPIQRQGQIVGALTVFNKEDGAFGKNDLRLTQSIANQLGVAILNSQLYVNAIDEKERSDAIIDNASEGICVLDAERKILKINKAWEEITGWTNEDAIGNSCADLQKAKSLEGDDICNTQCCFNAMECDHKSVFRREVMITTKSGMMKRVFTSHTFVTMSSGERWCIIMMNEAGSEVLGLVQNETAQPATA